MLKYSLFLFIIVSLCISLYCIKLLNENAELSRTNLELNIEKDRYLDAINTQNSKIENFENESKKYKDELSKLNNEIENFEEKTIIIKNEIKNETSNEESIKWLKEQALSF